MATTTDHPDRGELVDVGPGQAVGFIGVVSPMTSLGLAPFSYLGVVYREGLALSSAALYQVTFSRQQERIVDDLLDTSFAELSSRDNVRVYGRAQIERVELCRQFAIGYRLNMSMRGGTTTRLIVQQRRLDEIRRCLPELVTNTWADETLTAA